MNRVYKSVWNERSGTWVAAPESGGRSGATGPVRAGAVALLLAAGMPLAAHAQLSLGLGAIVTGGTGAIALGPLLGSSATASGSNSLAIGVNVTASGADALALSRNSTAAGAQGVAVGFGSLVSAAATGGLALGSATSVTGSGSIALGSGSSDGGLANVLSVGTSSLQRKIINVGDATLSAVSHDAVTGAQLFSTNAQVGLNTADIGTLTTSLATANANIGANTTAIAANAAGLVSANVNIGNLTSGLATATSNIGTLTTGLATASANITSANAAISANAAGLVSANVNIGNLTSGLAGAVTNIANNTTSIANLTNLVNTGGTGLVQQAGANAAVTVAAATGGNLVDVTGTAGARVVTGVAAGSVAAGSVQAVNGGQLFQTNTQVAANAAAITVNSTDIANLAQQVNSGSAGLVQQATPSSVITVAAATGGMSVDFSGTSGARRLTGVADGTLAAGSTSAVNGGQLYATNLRVSANLDAINANAANIASNAAAINGLNAGALQYDNAGKTAVTLGGAGGTVINNVAPGALTASSMQAVNGAQLYATNQQVAANTASIATLNTALASSQGGGGESRAVTYDVNPDQTTNWASVSLGVAGTPVVLRNVAAGRNASDAVNVGQLQSVSGFIGGGMLVNSTGAVIAPSFNLTEVAADGSTSSASYSTVAAALGSLSNSVGNLAGQSAGHSLRIAALAPAGGGGAGDGADTVNNITNVVDTKYININSLMNDSSAAGHDSVAIGPVAEAQAARAIAIGRLAQAATASSVAIGDGAWAGGGMAVSVGTGNIATGNGAVAIGDPNVATGTGAVAMGADNTAIGDGAVALGNLSVATGNGAVALGNVALANGVGGVAIGNAANVSAAAPGGVAIGSGSSSTRAGLSGAREAISNVAVASTQGAVSVGSAGNERQITNVAGGTEDTDAVNLRQLRASQATAIEAASQATDAKLNNLAQGIERVEKNANSGTAAAMAMASMPQSAVPGRGMMSAGVGSFGGETAVAVGVSMVSDTGKWVAKLNGSANSRGKIGVGAGVGFQW